MILPGYHGRGPVENKGKGESNKGESNKGDLNNGGYKGELTKKVS